MKRMLTVCTALLTLLTGCQSIPQTLPPAEPAETETIVPDTAPDASPETQRPAGEDITITIALVSSPWEELSALIREFNEADNGYKIEVKQYDQYIDPADVADEFGSLSSPAAFDPCALRLQMDILQGGEVDIVPDHAFEGNLGRYEVLLKKGAFLDLYPFMEQDAEINTDTLNTHVLSLHETDGELRCLPLFYTVSTLYGNADYVGTKENWTFGEMQAHWETAPAGMTFNGATATKNYVYYTVLREELGSFLDYDNVTCTFDSPLFVNMLEFCNSFPDTPPNKEDNWNVNDFVAPLKINGYLRMHTQTDSSTTLVGYPSEDGQGASIDTAYQRWSICRSASPEVQEGAWQFIRMMAQEDFQRESMYTAFEGTDYIEERGFPINQRAADAFAEELIAKHDSGAPNTAYQQGYEIDLGWPSREECDKVNAYIEGIRKLETNLNYSLQNIVEEEIWRMFDGIQTPEQTAKAIQGRAEIMVSEQS